MKMIRTILILLLLVFLSSSAFARAGTEKVCDDGRDNDGDSVMDCADSDCARTPACQADGQPENTDARCSDWIDNDENGAIDCDDIACLGSGVLACQGSWQRNRGNVGAGAVSRQTAGDNAGGSESDVMGKEGDNDGERNDLVCSDGIDNDEDGRVDCADYGCRFNPEVSVCQDRSGMRFSVVGAVAQSYDFEEKVHDTQFTKLQLRTFGTIPAIQDSFYLISMRAEKVPRLTFAMFQIPVWGDHKLNLNSGGGGISNAPVLSSAKQLLLDPPYYLVNAFEQGNGAAVELSGPVETSTIGFGDGAVRYRVYAGGGAGRSSGNVGGRYYTYDNTNYTWSVGGQMSFNFVGYVSRWDSQFLLVPASPVPNSWT